MKKNSSIAKALTERILVLDGAMGTSIQNHNLSEADFGGSIYDGCNEYLTLTQPDLIKSIHASFLDAGADVIETNTFGGAPFVLNEFDLGDQAYDINLAAAQLAKEVAHNYSNPNHPRYVAGSIGPTTKSISVTGGIDFDELAQQYQIQIEALVSGGVDYLLFETCQDTLNLKAGFIAAQRAFKKLHTSLPIGVSATIEPMGTMLAGQSIESFWISISHLDLLYVGLNCATGPAFMTDSIRSLSNVCTTGVGCVPNAGLPDENGAYSETPESMSEILSRFAQEGWINVLGGCCGTQPDHIRAFSKIAQTYPPRKAVSHQRSFISGIDFVEVESENRPLLVGERTNVIGSRKFKKLICDEAFESAVEIGRAQVKSGAQIVDVCLANPDRDELKDMDAFLSKAVKMIKAPLMIDSTDPEVIEMALKKCQGKAIVNSINLEDGEARLSQVIPLLKTYGAAVVAGCIDDDPLHGMAISVERKCEVAQRIYRLLTETYGIPAQDIYWDALVFPCATGDQQYLGSAALTIEGIAALKKALPLTKTCLGISNVSFGLPVAGREVLNSVFLYLCVESGLDLAIVNTQMLRRYASISDAEKKLCLDLIFNRGSDPITPFANFYRDKKKHTPKANTQSLSLEERLSNYIIEGSKEGLTADLDTALKSSRALEIINGPLMKGMDTVGELFNKNELIVAEVLQSAEAMKAAVSHLEPFIDKSETVQAHRFILATVKGDVHDIGKNLVDIIFSNNGFDVINLGIKVTPETLIQEIKKHQPRLIGLSGLLVKSAQQMVLTAKDLSDAGINLPLMVGGAALSRTFTENKIQAVYQGTVTYAQDAMNGLSLAKDIVKKDGSGQKLTTDQSQVPDISDTPASNDSEDTNPLFMRSDIQAVPNPPQPRDYHRRILSDLPLREIWQYINPRMLLGRHLGLPNREVDALTGIFSETGPTSTRSQKIYDQLNELKNDIIANAWIQPQAVLQFLPAWSTDSEIHLKHGATTHVISLPRQKKTPYLCLSDYLPTDANNNDNVAVFVVSVGNDAQAVANDFKNQGQYLKSHMLAALALETAEAIAEYIHLKIRDEWQLDGEKHLTLKEVLQGKYTGKRYSFGYPACPNLENQSDIFSILKPEDIGVQLTEGFMMEPEASVSALVFHHPAARYFST